MKKLKSEKTMPFLCSKRWCITEPSSTKDGASIHWGDPNPYTMLLSWSLGPMFKISKMPIFYLDLYFEIGANHVWYSDILRSDQHPNSGLGLLGPIPILFFFFRKEPVGGTYSIQLHKEKDGNFGALKRDN
jgi:hypothetical protein